MVEARVHGDAQTLRSGLAMNDSFASFGWSTCLPVMPISSKWAWASSGFPELHVEEGEGSVDWPQATCASGGHVIVRPSTVMI